MVCDTNSLLNSTGVVSPTTVRLKISILSNLRPEGDTVTLLCARSTKVAAIVNMLAVLDHSHVLAQLYWLSGGKRDLASRSETGFWMLSGWRTPSPRYRTRTIGHIFLPPRMA
mgnify:CR=1 FL=1